MGRRANGQGAVYLRGDGRWEGQLRLPAGGRNLSTRGLGTSCYGSSARPIGCMPKGCQSVRENRPGVLFSLLGWRWSATESGRRPTTATSSTCDASASCSDLCRWFTSARPEFRTFMAGCQLKAHPTTTCFKPTALSVVRFPSCAFRRLIPLPVDRIRVGC